MGQIFAWVLLLMALVPERASGAVPWQEALGARVPRLDAREEGRIGVYVKDLKTGEEFSWRGEENWYFASGVKVPIAIEVLRQIEQGRISFGTRVTLRDEDYLDGAGRTNARKAGARLSVRFLLEEMLVRSDNTASDLLIRLVGLDRVNATIQEWVPERFSEITTLAEVRRRAYSELHPAATHLRNPELLSLGLVRGEERKVAAFARLIGKRVGDLPSRDLAQAFETYYARGYNSGTLSAYGRLLERIARGNKLKPQSRRYLLDILSRVETGPLRLRAGLGESIVLAHKTGTQFRRICDLGLAWPKGEAARGAVVIAACARGFRSRPEAERALAAVGAAVRSSGIFLAAGRRDGAASPRVARVSLAAPSRRSLGR
ncbi:MAG: class A beta-lactamase-related serine hydrolase [Oligoflexia bacterium]|nr:class A beta-lactamase-related serine hydrolase [Oligoflexia bacterium]